MSPEEFARHLDALDHEHDEAKRQWLRAEFHAVHDRELARATVGIVEQVRAQAGDKAAEEMLPLLRELQRPKD